MGRKRFQRLAEMGESMAAVSGSKPGAGFAKCAKVTRTKQGHKIITEIAVDLGCTGSHIGASTTAGDVIGAKGIDGAYLCQLAPAQTGYITYVEMVCTEAPTGAERDIDLVMCGPIARTGSFDDKASDMSSTTLVESAANWTLGRIDHYAVAHGTALDLGSEFQYLYLINGASGEPGTYATGKFVITVEGYKVNKDL